MGKVFKAAIKTHCRQTADQANDNPDNNHLGPGVEVDKNCPDF